MHLKIHSKIIKKLEHFYENRRIPNLLFYGPSGSGKKKIIFDYLNKIYNNDMLIFKKYTLIVNCAHEKGIKFVREELKFFAKTNLPFTNNIHFKTIVLLNGEKLTMDAQSALRRCIELYSHSTRFFVLVQEKDKILKPILSRFCEIYIPLPIVNNKVINLNEYNRDKIFTNNALFFNLRKQTIEQKLISFIDIKEKIFIDYLHFAEELVNDGFYSKELLDLVEENEYIKNKISRCKMLENTLIIYKLQKEIRSEKILMLNILYLFLISSNLELENISFI